MKNLSKIVFIISIIFVTASCTKDKTISSINNTTTPKQQVGGNGVGTAVNMGNDDCCEDYTTYLSIDAGEWCCSAGTNCAACVTIVGATEETLDHLVESGPSAVAEFFNGSEWIDIFPTLGTNNPEMLDKLQSGNYSLDKLYDSELNKIIYKAYNSENDYFGLPTIKE